MIKKIDDVGRVAIPKDLRRALRWMGGDDIEIIEQGNDTLLLRKHTPDFEKKLRECQESFTEWAQDNGIQEQKQIEQMFDELFAAMANVRARLT